MPPGMTLPLEETLVGTVQYCTSDYMIRGEEV